MESHFYPPALTPNGPLPAGALRDDERRGVIGDKWRVTSEEQERREWGVESDLWSDPHRTIGLRPSESRVPGPEKQ